MVLICFTVLISDKTKNRSYRIYLQKPDDTFVIWQRSTVAFCTPYFVFMYFSLVCGAMWKLSHNANSPVTLCIRSWAGVVLSLTGYLKQDCGEFVLVFLVFVHMHSCTEEGDCRGGVGKGWISGKSDPVDKSRQLSCDRSTVKHTQLLPPPPPPICFFFI